MSGLSQQAISLSAFGLLGLAYLLFAALWFMPGQRGVVRDLAGVLPSATLIALLVFGLPWIGGWWLYAALVLLGGRIGYEVGFVRFRPDLAWVNAFFAAGVTAAALLVPLPLLLVITAIYALSGFLAVLPKWLWPIGAQRRLFWQQSRPALQALAFPALPFLLLAKALTLPAYAPLMLLAYILVESFDGYALVAGKLLGRTPAFPRLSPRKTIEGLAGGALMLVLTALALAWLLDLPMGAMALTAAVTAILAVAGDLIASHYKRLAGVKDYPVLMARQGGAFDSLDSWIAVGGGLTILATLAGWV